VAGEPDFHPTAPVENLRLRAALLRAVRRFFEEREYLEVETPLVSADATVDPNLIPFATQFRLPGAGPLQAEGLFLQTSPEFAMKRLLAVGHEAIYQVTHAFRNAELGPLHNPEFTILEWYRVGDTYHEQMDVVEALVRCVFGMPEAADAPRLRPQAFERLTYKEAFERHAGLDSLTAAASDFPQIAESRGVVPPPGLTEEDRDGWLNFLLVELVEPKLGVSGPEFLYDYPASQAALARVRPDEPPVAERFELYVRGIELCNGYQELTDAGELRWRIRDRFGRSAERLLESRLLDAMEAGLPDCSGVALGFDRLVMLAVGAESLSEVMPFPFPRA